MEYIPYYYHTCLEDSEGCYRDVVFSLEVAYYHKQPPFNGYAWLCDSMDDFYGFTEIDWKIVRIFENGTFGNELTISVTPSMMRDMESFLLEQLEKDYER